MKETGSHLIIEQGKQLIIHNRYNEAEQLLKSEHHNDPVVYDLIGISLAKQQKYEEAIPYYLKALELKSDFPEVLNNLGSAYEHLGQYGESIDCFRRAIRHSSDYLRAYVNLGNVLRKIGRYRAALNSYLIARKIGKPVPDLLLNIGLTMEKLERYEPALDTFQELVARYPEYWEGHNKLGLSLQQAGKLEAAEEVFRKGIDCNPHYLRFYGNLGNLLQKRGHYREALSYYNRAIEMEPKYYEALFSRSLLYLLFGNFKQGWADYEYRWKLNSVKMNAFDAPRWQGESLKDKMILLWAEQGYGDAVQFIRYVPLVKRRGGRIVLASPRSLLSLFRSVKDVDVYREEGQADSIRYDFHSPLMSLPGVFNTTQETIPADVPYLAVEARRQAKIDERLNLAADKLNVGIVWSGNPSNKNDFNRSCKLEHFELLQKIDGIALYSLQKGQAAEQLANRGNASVVNLDPLIADFSDTAAIIQRLDLVISIDTAVAHLAGALAKPVWILLPYYPDFRWMLNRDDSPWYPTMRIIRQPEPGDWRSVFQRIQSRLLEEVSRKLHSDVQELPAAIRLFKDGQRKAAQKLFEKIGQRNPTHPVPFYYLALIARQAKDYKTAVIHLEKAIACQPDCARYYIALGDNYFDLKEMSLAESNYIKALTVDIDQADAYFKLGKLLYYQEDSEQALYYLKRSLEIDGELAIAYYYIGNVYYSQNRIEQAIKAYLKSIKLDETLQDACCNLGVAYKRIGKYARATEYFKKAIDQGAASAPIYSNLGNTYLKLGEFQEAEKNYLRAIEIDPEYAIAYFNLGKFYQDRGDVKRAEEYYRKALQIRPQFPEVMSNLCNILKDRGALDESLQMVQEAVRLSPDNPYHLNSLGNVYDRLNRFSEAARCYQKAIRIRPAMVAAYSNLGSTYMNLREIDKAFHYLDASVALDPGHVEAHWNRAINYLLVGNFKQGWPGYEWRWEKPDFQQLRRNFRQKRWDGSIQRDKTLLLWAEQGFGDTIQMIRLAKRVRARVKRLIVEVPASLKKLLRSVDGIDCIVSKGEPLPEFDLHLPLMSLPQYFINTEKDIPGEVPYIRCPDEQPISSLNWQKYADSFKVGIVWAGAAHHQNDYNRSCPVHYFRQLGELADLKIFSLQKAPRNQEIEQIATDIQIVDLDKYLRDFSATAAIIERLDLVISVDTAVAHLAGSMGQPVWVLLPYNPDWRWMLERNDTAWYPTMTLFRQAQIGDWDPVFSEVVKKLKTVSQASS